MFEWGKFSLNLCFTKMCKHNSHAAVFSLCFQLEAITFSQNIPNTNGLLNTNCKLLRYFTII